MSDTIGDQIVSDSYHPHQYDYEIPQYEPSPEEILQFQKEQKIYDSLIKDVNRWHKRELYRKAILFNFNISTGNIHDILIEYSDLVLFEDIKQDINDIRKIIRAKYCKALRLIVANLYNAYKYRYWLMVYRNSAYYSKTHEKLVIKENHSIFSYTLITTLFDLLFKRQVLYVKKGFRNNKKSQLTRYYPTGELREKFQHFEDSLGLAGNKISDILHISDERVLVRDFKLPKKKKGPVIPDIIKNVHFPVKKRHQKLEILKRIKSEVDAINNFLFNTEITIPYLATPQDHRKALTLKADRRFLLELKKDTYLMLEDCKRVTRIFNDANIELGGRIYAPYQQFNEGTRKRFLINGEKVQLIDISSSHIRMLYHMCKFDFQGDAYDIILNRELDSPEKLEIIRTINKKILQALINAKNEHAATASALQSIKDTLKDYGKQDLANRFNSQDYAEEWIKRFKDKHQSINRYFHSGFGKRLQYIESKIIINSILDLIEEQVPALSVHDELIVPYSKRCLAKRIIENNYKKEQLFNGFAVILDFE